MQGVAMVEEIFVGA